MAKTTRQLIREALLEASNAGGNETLTAEHRYDVLEGIGNRLFGALNAAPVVPVVTEDARYAALYGRCPKCNGLGAARERRPDGNDKCVNGHVYPSRDAITAASEVRG